MVVVGPNWRPCLSLQLWTACGLVRWAERDCICPEDVFTVRISELNQFGSRTAVHLTLRLGERSRSSAG